MMALLASPNLTLKPSSYNVFNYNKSKLLNIVFTKVLSQELKGTTVTVYSVHPGVFHSQIYDNVSTMNRILAFVLFKHFIIVSCTIRSLIRCCYVTQVCLKHNYCKKKCFNGTSVTIRLIKPVLLCYVFYFGLL